jgi:phage baseplate assembly protein W
VDRLQTAAGVAFPLAVDERGAIALVTTGDHVDQAIGLILATAPGERAMRPDFGCDLHRFTFETIDAGAVARIEADVRAALARWEPRIEVLSVEVDLARIEERTLRLTVGYRVRATGALRLVTQAFEMTPVEPEAGGGSAP